jgi:hypothetical protein
MLKMAHNSEFKEIPLTHIYSENSRGLGVADMARCIETGEKPRANGELANHVLEIMHGFHDASRNGKHYELSSTCTRPEPLKPGLSQDEIFKL